MKFSLEAIYTWYRNTIRHPKYRWWVILGTLLYFISPIDLVPDILFPGIGELDDVFLMGILVSEVSQMAIEGIKKRKGKTVDAPETGKETTVEVGAVSVD